MKNPVRPECVEGRAGFFIHRENVVGRPCFDIALKKQLFYAYKINHLKSHKKTKNRVKQRLFHGNAMRPKAAYFAQHERPTTDANVSF